MCPPTGLKAMFDEAPGMDVANKKKPFWCTIAFM
jgi:hypothetical protein